MAVVTVQLGQCGNQLGGQLFTSLMDDIHSKSFLSRDRESEYRTASIDRFFSQEDSGLPRARAVLVDMEPKVIAQVKQNAERSGKWVYRDKLEFSQKKGSGNNWAHGFCVHGRAAREPVVELVRQEVERCDRLDGFLTLMSLAGGTGSGVGAYMTHALREEYPNANMINPVVWPYDSGEVCVQNYNAVLTLAHLYQSTDAVLAVENDQLHQICTRLLALKKVSFNDLNGVFTNQLASTLLPSFNGIGDLAKSNFVKNPLGSLVEHLVSHPGYKLLSLRAIPQQSHQARDYNAYIWPGLMKHLRQMLVARAVMEEGIDWSVKASASQRHFNHSVANLMVARGNELNAVDYSPFKDPLLYTDWMFPEHSFRCWSNPRPYLNNDKFAVLISNSQMAAVPLNRVISKAWQMFASRAYVHHYLRHGLSEEDFVNCFASLEQVLSDYIHLGGSEGL